MMSSCSAWNFFAVFFSWAAFSRPFNWRKKNERKIKKKLKKLLKKLCSTKVKQTESLNKAVLLDTVQPSLLFSGLFFVQKNIYIQIKKNSRKNKCIFPLSFWAHFHPLSLLVFSSAVSRFILMCSDIRAVSEGLHIIRWGGNQIETLTPWAEGAWSSALALLLGCQRSRKGSVNKRLLALDKAWGKRVPLCSWVWR